MANSANLPAPFRGMDTKTPIAVLQNPFCRKLLNFNVTEAGISLRNGDSLVVQTSLSGGLTYNGIIGIFRYSEDLALVVTDSSGGNKYYTLTGGVLTLLGTYADSLSYCRAGMFNKNLYISSASGGFVRRFDGSAMQTVGYTGVSGAMTCTGYKNRNYILNGTSSYYYSDIDAITGAVTQVDLASILEIVSSLSVIGALSLADPSQIQDVLVIVSEAGEVLYYSGSYPNGSDWTIIGRAKIPSLISPNVLRYNGDVLVATKSGLYSLKALYFNGGDPQKSFCLSKEIQEYWDIVARKIADSGLELLISMAFWDKKNEIIISFPIGYDNEVAPYLGNTMFVYNIIEKAWSMHTSTQFDEDDPSGYIIEHGDEILLSSVRDLGSQTGSIFSKEGSSGYTDRNIADNTDLTYDYEMLSAPIPFPKNANYETTTIEPILESDLYAQTNWNFVADFGRQTSGDQKTDAGTTSVAKPAVNVGMQNITYVQVKMSGTTAASKTVGLDLYSYNVWYNAGEIGSR